ncbi:MAG: hypothetical protein U0840_02800 [Gemmataceae bacterium]
MRIAHLLWALAMVGVGSAQVRATDLSKIDRTIAKEPVYKSRPRYCLLVFGPEARTRFWLVLDGDVLYVDRTGNGDLTNASAKVNREKVFKSQNSLYAEQRLFQAGDITEGAAGPKHTELTLHHCIPNPTFVPTATDDKQARALLDRNPDAVVVIVEIKVGGRLRQVAAPAFSHKPQDAPILHFNGPLTMGFHPKWFYGWPVLTRGDTPSTLTVVIGTPGVGEGSFALIGYDDVPKDVHPIVRIQFPAKAPGKAPIVVTVPLKHRC